MRVRRPIEGAADAYFTRRMFLRQYFPALASAAALTVADMADAIVVGNRMGAVGLAALSFALPIFMIYNVIMHSLGMGGSILYASLMANNAMPFNEELASQLLVNAFVGAVTPAETLFDQRQKKTAVNKAALQRQNYELELKNQQTALYSTIEDYWLQAENNQSRYKAAKVSTKSAQDSYDMLTGKFKNNLINIVELMTGKDKLLAAQQAELQAKYLTILNIELLRFYQTGVLTVK